MTPAAEILNAATFTATGTLLEVTAARPRGWVVSIRPDGGECPMRLRAGDGMADAAMGLIHARVRVRGVIRPRLWVPLDGGNSRTVHDLTITELVQVGGRPAARPSDGLDWRCANV